MSSLPTTHRPKYPPTSASRLSWLPVGIGLAGIGAAASVGGTLGLLFAPAGAAIAGAIGYLLSKKHSHERAAQEQERIEQIALRAYRRHEGSRITKEQLVRDHALHPNDANAVLDWLVSHELLRANWDDIESPLVFERNDDQASFTPAPPPKPASATASVHVHHHQAPPLPPSFVQPKSPGFAALLSLFWPGFGQAYSGDVGRGIAIFFGVPLAYAFFVLPGLYAHFWNIMDARRSAEKVNRDAAEAARYRAPTLPGQFRTEA